MAVGQASGHVQERGGNGAKMREGKRGLEREKEEKEGRERDTERSERVAKPRITLAQRREQLLGLQVPLVVW